MKKQTLFLALLLFSVLSLPAQINVYDIEQPVEDKPLTRNHQWEVGLHAGHFFTSGNVDFLPGYGAGLHIRRATDYVFSLRMDLMYGKLRGEDPGNIRSFQNTWFSGSLVGIASLNSLKWNTGERKTNFYALTGLGANSFDVILFQGEEAPEIVDKDIAMHTDIGVGMAFKVSEKLNVGIEHKFSFVLGDRSDLPDGVETFSIGESRSTFRDVLHYTSIKINFNIGKRAVTEPLYWVNPLDSVLNEVNTVKETTKANKEAILASQQGGGTYTPSAPRTNSDGNSPMGTVETGPGVVSGGGSDQPKLIETIIIREKEPNVAKEEVMAELEQMIDERMMEIQASIPPATTEEGQEEPETTAPPKRTSPPVATAEPKETAPAPAPPRPRAPVSNNGGNTVISLNNYLILSTVYFDNGSSSVKDRNVLPLASLANSMKENPDLRLLVIGHADQTGDEAVNDLLSYKRADAVVKYLVKFYKIPRNRLVLRWRGERDPVVGGSHAVNRRVTFEEAFDEKDMGAPSKKKK